jgi:hypothetical protein
LLSMPYWRSPIRDSPLSFSNTLLYFIYKEDLSKIENKWYC